MLSGILAIGNVKKHGNGVTLISINSNEIAWFSGILKIPYYPIRIVLLV